MYCPNKKPSTEILTGLMTRNKHTIITGEFNSKHVDFGHDIDDFSGTSLVNITNQYKFTKLNDNQPTYTNERTGKQDVKDLIFSSPTMTRIFIDFWVDEDIGSDHNIIQATFSQNGITNPQPTKNIKLYHKANWKIINETITDQMTNDNIDHNSSRHDIDKYITKLTSTITDTLNHNIKTKTITNNKIGLPKHIVKMIKDKKYYRKQWKKHILNTIKHFTTHSIMTLKN